MLRRFFTALGTIGELPCEVVLQDPMVIDHLTKVLRYQSGQELILIDQSAYHAVILGKPSHIRLNAKIELPQPKLPEIVLAAVVLKEQKWDWLLQKATELGVSRIQPLMSRYGVVEISSQKAVAKQERWQDIVRSAAQQSEQVRLPKVETPMTLKDWLNQPSEGQRLMLLERGIERQSLKKALKRCQPPITLLVGPEGGWHSTELPLALEAGFVPVSLGETILRSETAAITAISQVRYEYSE